MEHIYDMIIVGSGPAGLAAAIYASRARLDAILMEESYATGGQVLTTPEIDNYPGVPGTSGFSLATAFRGHAEKMKAVFERVSVKKIVPDDPAPGIKRVITNHGEYLTRTIVLATGAAHKHLGVPGEEEYKGKGVSYCAHCDGAFFRDKTTVVVGGGDVAVGDAMFLSRICQKVYLVHRRGELRAAKSLQESLRTCRNVEIIWNHTLTEIQGDGKVTGVVLQDVGTKVQTELPVDGVFIGVGMTPNSAAGEGLLEQDAAGYIVAGEEGKTSVPGIYAAGDVRTKALRQIVTAVADGANCVASAEKYLAEQ
ncbi:MAG: thioredoxin-disulfide reductase [Lachnospiraceae bacterium]|jgi:thioredoxin reductase (NADPH)